MPFHGVVAHFAGVRMAHFRIVKNMADHVGDRHFSEQCQTWLDQASTITEKSLWNDEAKSYLLYWDNPTGRKSDVVMSSQLDGEWMCALNGLPGVFQKDRVREVLHTIETSCVVDAGLSGFANPQGQPLLQEYGSFTPEMMIVAMIYMYQGQKDTGLEIARRAMDNIVRVQGHGWDMPNLIRCDTGERTYGCDYFQNLVLWGLPAAMAGSDLSGPCQDHGLIDRVLQAGKAPLEIDEVNPLS